MRGSNLVVPLTLAIAAGVGSFLGARAVGSANTPLAKADSTASCKACTTAGESADASPLASWLRLTQGQARAMAHGEFSQEAATLNQTLEQQREKLIGMFETPDMSDEAILQQVEQVIAAHDALERYVAAYVVGLRKTLTPQQQRRLMGLCASSMRNNGCQGQCTQCPCMQNRGGGQGLCQQALQPAPANEPGQ